MCGEVEEDLSECTETGKSWVNIYSLHVKDPMPQIHGRRQSSSPLPIKAQRDDKVFLWLSSNVAKTKKLSSLLQSLQSWDCATYRHLLLRLVNSPCSVHNKGAKVLGCCIVGATPSQPTWLQLFCTSVCPLLPGSSSQGSRTQGILVLLVVNSICCSFRRPEFSS